MQIRSAINANDVSAFQSLLTLPLLVTEQQWRSVDDGVGFVLGERSDRKIGAADNTFTELKQLIESVAIQGELAMTDGIELALFTDELREQLNHWRQLELVLFKRGEADVEHIVLLGLDKKTKQLRAIYLN